MASYTLEATERETLINLTDASRPWCSIYSEIRSVITRIRRLAASHPDNIRIIREGHHGKTPYIEAIIPWSFIGLRPSKNLPTGTVPESILSAENTSPA